MSSESGASLPDESLTAVGRPTPLWAVLALLKQPTVGWSETVMAQSRKRGRCTNAPGELAHSTVTLEKRSGQTTTQDCRGNGFDFWHSRCTGVKLTFGKIFRGLAWQTPRGLRCSPLRGPRGCFSASRPSSAEPPLPRELPGHANHPFSASQLGRIRHQSADSLCQRGLVADCPGCAAVRECGWGSAACGEGRQTGRVAAESSAR